MYMIFLNIMHMKKIKETKKREKWKTEENLRKSMHEK